MNTHTTLREDNPSPQAQPQDQATRKIFGIALAVLFCLLLLAPKAARGGEVSMTVGYGVLGKPSPLVDFSLSSGKRVVLDFNGGIIFAKPDTLRFNDLFHTFAVEEKIKGVKIPTGNQLYSIGLDVRVLVRKFGKKHNAYVGAGVDWLPQLEIYYPGIKVTTGYQIALRKKRNLIVRVGTEYYFYGVVPANALSFKSSLGYRF